MKITLTKNMTLRVATVYMKIRKNISRIDIQEYLKGKQFENKLINNRINEYLKEIRIYDDELHLTQRGEIVRDRGLLSTYEEGKYRIWFTQGDDFWGNRIMYFRREAPNEKSSLKPLDLNFDADKHFLLPAIEKSEEINPTNFSLDDNNLVGDLFQKTESISVKIIFENEKPTYCFFSGKLGKENSIELNHKEPIVEQNESFEKVIFEILPDYDNDYKRLKVPLNLMPIDLENAKRWRDSLVRDIVAQQYLSPQDFQSKVIEVNDNPAFEKYRNDMDVLESENFKTEIGGVEYWHLHAPIDLNPNSLFTNINEIITLQKGDKISFAEIISKLGIASENDVVIYYDKYITNERQQKAASALMESINATKAVIVTDMSPQNMKSNYIKEYRKDIRMRDLNHGIFSKHPSHDRYLIVGDKYWSITNSIDFIRFSERDITKDTQGTVNQNVTFTPISILDNELLNFVNSEKNGK